MLQGYFALELANAMMLKITRLYPNYCVRRADMYVIIDVETLDCRVAPCDAGATEACASASADGGGIGSTLSYSR